jgi:6-pyruvoyltetrahydropterin/6-carboxytetrahydropterin synthase
MITCTKIYTDIPFAHRQPNHKGHCAMIHGHNWSFKFTFATDELDSNGFVVDFGELQWLRMYLNTMFDHKLLLNENDPMLGQLADFLGRVPLGQDINAHGCLKLADIVTVPNCGAEGLAQFLLDAVGRMVRTDTSNRVFLLSVTVSEDSKNSATASESIFESNE